MKSKKHIERSRSTRRSTSKPATKQQQQEVHVQPEYFEDGHYVSRISRLTAAAGLASALVLE